MRSNPKSKANAGRRRQWDPKAGKSVQKKGRPAANKPPANVEMIEYTKDELVRMGTPAAKAELKRRGRREDGRKMAWGGAAASAKPKMSRKSSRKRKARGNPDVSALAPIHSNPHAEMNPSPYGRFFIRLPVGSVVTAQNFDSIAPDVLYFVGPGSSLDKKAKLVLATFDYRMGDFGDKHFTTRIKPVRSEAQALKELRSGGYPGSRSARDRWPGPYELFQVRHTGQGLTRPQLVSSEPFSLDRMAQLYPKILGSAYQPAEPYPYPYPPRAIRMPKYPSPALVLGVDQIVDNLIYASGRDPMIPWGQGPALRRVLVSEYVGSGRGDYVETTIDQRLGGNGVMQTLQAAELPYALQAMADTLCRNNPRLKNPAMIEWRVLPQVQRGDILVTVAQWKLVRDNWAYQTPQAQTFRGYPPSEESQFLAPPMGMPSPDAFFRGPMAPRPGAAGGAAPMGMPGLTPAQAAARARILAGARPNPDEDEVFDFIEEDEDEALDNPPRRRRRRSRRRSHKR